MSMVSSSNLMSRFLPFSSHHQAQARVVRSLATNNNAKDEGKNNNEYHVNEIAAIAVADQLADQLKNLAVAAAIAIAEEASVSPMPSRNSVKTSFSNGGLKRTVSSLHNGMPSTSAGASAHSPCCSSLASSLASRSSDLLCTHANHKNTCIVEAKQVIFCINYFNLCYYFLLKVVLFYQSYQFNIIIFLIIIDFNI